MSPIADMSPTLWLLRAEPRKWQKCALVEWKKNMRGVASVVTGGGKTILAFFCMREFWKKNENGRVLIIVPTVTLLDQWYVSLLEDFGIPSKAIACFSGQDKPKRPKVVNILVINTARQLAKKLASEVQTFLIVDECHRAGSPENSKILKGLFSATLGLSATPHREYDRGFEHNVVPVLGPVIFEYNYKQARVDGIVSPFSLVNVQIDLLPDEQKKYDHLTKRIAILLQKSKIESGALTVNEQLRRILQMRAAVSSTARMRIPVAAKLVDENRGARTIVFHERVKSANILFDVLSQRNHSVCCYHTQIAPELRRDNLRLFRRGVFDVLISCRALDEGMNVPETRVAVIASSTASQRQRIQRLGRVLRPAEGKGGAIIYTLYATKHERKRLQKEALEFEDTAQVTWSLGQRI